MSGAIMTSYPFAPRFFERTVLPALRDKSLGDQIAILADASHYDATLTDEEASDNNRLECQQPRYVGQRYHLAPVPVGANRAFHPKLQYITGERRVMASVSSANLTHPGLTNNREIATLLKVDASIDEDTQQDSTPTAELVRGEQAAICTDISDFFRSLVDSSFGNSIDPITSRTIEQTLEASDWLTEIERPDATERTTRFLHSLDQPLISQIKALLEEQDEQIEQVDIAAPFYGTSLAVPRVFTNDGIQTRLWLQQGRVQIPIKELERWLESPVATALAYGSNRYVHGKVLRIKTTDADYCLTGSPNASQAALLSSATHDHGNIEAALLRRGSSSDSFAYLFETSPFSTADPVSMDSLEVDDSLDLFNETDEASSQDTPSEEELQLHGVSYQRRDSYDGGTLTVTGQATEDLQEMINESGIELLVAPAHDSGDSPATVRLDAHKFDWDETVTPRTFSISIDRYGEAAERPFLQAAKASLQTDDHASQPRWVQTHIPTTGEPTSDDVEDAGATTVPLAITELFLGDEERRTEIMQSLNGLLSALRTTAVKSETPENTEQPEQEGPSGGLRVRPWNQTTSNSPANLLESFYDGWQSDLDEFARAATDETPYFEEIETRLHAVNTATLQLLLLDDARSSLTVPCQPAVNAIKDVYSDQDPRGERGTSLMADYCYNLCYYATKSDTNETEIYTGLQTHIVPQILLATIIAEAHIAGDRETFFQQQGWAFESLLCDCFPNGFPTGEQLRDEWIDEVERSLHDSLEGVQSRIDGSRQLQRYADNRYMQQDHTRQAVIDQLARGILYTGQDAITTFRSNPIQGERVEQVFEEFNSYLPSRKRRQIQRIL